MPSSSHSRSSGSLLRNDGENWFCTLTSRPPSTCWASRIWSGFALLIPAIRMTPSSSSSASAPTDSAYGTDGSGRWNWCRPIASTPSRFAEALVAALMCSGRPSWVQEPSPGRRWPDLVATSTPSGSPPQVLSASAMRVSLCPTSSACSW